MAFRIVWSEAALADLRDLVRYIARDDRHAFMAAAAARFFAPLLEVINLPAWDCLPYDRVSPSPGVAAQRCAALARLWTQGVVLPEWAITAGLVLMALGGAIMGILQGKNADGSVKTVNQLAKQNEDK
jgi:transcription-repair coupling factor (superfamily II helicase)